MAPLSVGAILLVGVIFAPAVNAQWVSPMALLLGTGAALLLSGLGLRGLRMRLTQELDRWRVLVFGVEAALGGGGYAVWTIRERLAANAPRSALPGTDGPLADGLDGALILLAFAGLTGWVVAAVVACEPFFNRKKAGSDSDAGAS